MLVEVLKLCVINDTYPHSKTQSTYIITILGQRIFRDLAEDVWGIRGLLRRGMTRKMSMGRQHEAAIKDSSLVKKQTLDSRTLEHEL